MCRRLVTNGKYYYCYFITLKKPFQIKTDHFGKSDEPWAWRQVSVQKQWYEQNDSA